jgi:hypothetical protein
MIDRPTLLISTFLLTVATAASADSPKIKGDYAFTGTSTCLVSLSGFNPNNTPVADMTFQNSASQEGIQHFNGDGTGYATGKQVAMTLPPAPLGTLIQASSSTFSFDFTYTVYEDGSFTTELVPGTFLGTYLTGPFVGTYTIDKQSLVGLLSNNNQAFTLAEITTYVETFTSATGSSPRICHRSRVGIAK